MATKVYQYGARAPLDLDLAMAHMRAGHAHLAHLCAMSPSGLDDRGSQLAWRRDKRPALFATVTASVTRPLARMLSAALTSWSHTTPHPAHCCIRA